MKNVLISSQLYILCFNVFIWILFPDILQAQEAPQTPPAQKAQTPFNAEPETLISTYDLLLLSKHINGAKSLETPYKTIAADINKSNSITSYDLSLLQKLVLGEPTLYPKAQPFRFVPADFVFETPLNPFVLPFDSSDADSSTAMKPNYHITMRLGALGDCPQYEATTGGSNPSSVVSWNMPAAEQGDTLTVPFIYTGTISLEAIQLGLRFDPAQMELIRTEAGDLSNFRASNVGLSQVKEGAVRMVWYPFQNMNERIKPGTILFYLTFKVLSTTEHWNFRLDDQMLENSGWCAEPLEYSILGMPNLPDLDRIKALEILKTKGVRRNKPAIAAKNAGKSLPAQRLYVRASATGNNSGQSWTNAFTDLQSALQIAQKGDSVWVAEGLYRPTNTIDRAVSFEPRSGVVVIGGFVGTETSLIQRDWAAHPTVLSGDIGLVGDSTDNSYNVMYLLEPDSATVLDGLILRDGVADNELYATDAYSRLICGGGLYIMGASSDAYPNILNCVFEHNTALYYGGGVIVNGNNNGSTAPKFLHCRFENNRAGGNGGGIAKYGASVVERGLDYDNCQFIGNQANQFGGGIYYLDGDGRDKIEMENCVLQKNTAKKRGGGAFWALGRESTSTFSCKNVDFIENISLKGAALDLFSNFQQYDGLILIDSCLLDKNRENLQASGGSILNIEVLSTPNTTININNCKIDANIAQYIYSFSLDGDLSIHNNIFINNNKLNQNINIYDNVLVFYSSMEKFKLKNSFFINNYQKIFFDQTDIMKSNYDNNYFEIPIFENLKSTFTNIIDSCTFTNCTFVNGQSSNFISPGTKSKKITFRNNYFNKPGTKIYLSNNYLGGFDCAAQPPNVICLDGNITSGDPMFTDTAQGNYTPLPCSPLVHAGNNAFVGLEDSVDLAGNPRIQGGRVDIGAYEAPAPQLAAPPSTVGACTGSASGAVTFDLAHACLPYQAQWSKNGTSGNGTTQLESGTYTFTLTDARGATCTATASIPVRDTFQLLPHSVPVQCGETEGGSASVSIQGASGPFSFLWSPAVKDSLRTNLVPGNYPLTVTDALGCTARSTVKVDALGNLDIDITATAITCYGADNGSLFITPLNGKPPFQFDWENGPASPAYGPLGPGVYKGTLTDAFGCRIVWILPLSEPDSLHLEAIITPVSDSVIHNGIIQVTGISGGTMPFTLAWSNGGTGVLLENLAPGAYTYTLTDAQGCTKTATYVVPLVVGTGEASKTSDIALWPNPAQDQVFIRDLGQMDANQCGIYNALGQVFYQASSMQLDTSVDIRQWPAGMYTCVVQGRSGKRWVGRFWVGR